MLDKKLSLTYCLSSIFLGACMVSPPPIWKTVEDSKLAQQLLSENGKGLLQVPELTKLQSSIRSLTLVPKSAPSLTVYNFNTKRLCGIGGCLHSVYLTSNGRLLFKILLNKKAIIDVDEKCIIFSQKNQDNSSSVRYCYQGNNYVQYPVSVSAE
jgi:hypothetical protein